MKVNGNKEIRSARPSLKQASPLSFWISTIFALANVGIAIALFRQPDHGGLIIEQGLFTTSFWAVVFLILSVGLTTGLARNEWRLVRRFLMIGLVVKSLFAYALVNLGLTVGFDGVFAVTVLWLTLACVQFSTVVFFLPPLPPPVKLAGKEIDSE